MIPQAMASRSLTPSFIKLRISAWFTLLPPVAHSYPTADPMI
ncbi:hypothetical protein PTRA_a1849 [Pseudoalteromonas translucida KMM 520]|uniref:Uncharacterized protein n=1 Tax=Pseudoalteromonas translucida KMM 520 TaxID=1315283 RepID=A0A0U2WZE9_9GAMM|nr:hypothetical protein PTRA_a1849 [Pseudoalteromonas translucida KMM 520]